MNPATELAPQLKQLRLSGILDSLDARNRQAIDAKLAYTEFLALLVQDELARREQKKFATRLRRAAFRATKTLEGFEFDRLPSTNRALVHDLATGRYIGEGFDDARLDTLFMAMPIAWKGTLVQYAGRLHRLHPGKEEVRIYDYLDDSLAVFRKMFEKRMKGYRAMGYRVDDAHGLPLLEGID